MPAEIVPVGHMESQQEKVGSRPRPLGNLAVRGWAGRASFRCEELTHNGSRWLLSDRECRQHDSKCNNQPKTHWALLNLRHVTDASSDHDVTQCLPLLRLI